MKSEISKTIHQITKNKNLDNEMINFNCNGNEGEVGQSGECSNGLTSQGIKGQDGLEGQKGGDATNLDLEIKAEEEQIVIIELDKINRHSKFPIADNEKQINIYSKGGKGGVGGQGGNGGKGIRGKNGRDATVISSGTDGSDGKPGGKGGDGGQGGEGGKGGVISLKICEQDMDLLMILNEIDFNGGECGKGGQGGQGGQGGEGGSGGRGFSSIKQIGKSISYHRMPGGIQGNKGIQGAKGKNGSDGVYGEKGKLNIIVGKQKYSSIYKLIVESVGTAFSDDNIIEPGEKLKINSLILKNVGKMPTPIHQRIILGLENNQYIQFNEASRIYISNSIKHLKTYKIETPLEFQIKGHTESAIDKVYKITVPLHYFAKVERVNRPFRSIAEKFTNYQIRFPVELSDIQVFKTIQKNEEAPIAFSILNLSRKPIGFETPEQRLLNVRIVLSNSIKIVQFIPKIENDIEKRRRNSLKQASISSSKSNFANNQNVDDNVILLDEEFITNIQPNEKKMISGTIKFTEFDFPYNKKVNLQVNLDLGCYSNPKEQYQTIQTRNFTVQLSQGYEYNQNSEFLLIINSETKVNLIDQFKSIAQSFGSNVDIWNISNYQGFDFDYIISNGLSFRQLYKDKVIIVLCNPYTLYNGSNTNPIKQIQERNIYKAAKFQQIRFYIIGQRELYDHKWVTSQNPSEISRFQRQEESMQAIYNRFSRDFKFEADTVLSNLSEQELTIQQQKQQTYSTQILETLYCCTRLKSSHFLNKCSQTFQKINQSNKNYYHCILIKEQPKVIQSSFFDKYYDLGNIKIVENLRKDFPQVIDRSCFAEDKEELDMIDRFSLIKLISFTQKITFFERSLSNFDNSKLVIDCIFSDLADEYITYIDSGIKRKEIPNYLKRWSLLQNFGFQKYFQQPKRKENIYAENEPINNTQIKTDPAVINQVREYLYQKIYQLRQIIQKQLNCCQMLFFYFNGNYTLVSYCIDALQSISSNIFDRKEQIQKQDLILKRTYQNINYSQLFAIQSPYENNVEYKDMSISNIHSKSEIIQESLYGQYNEQYKSEAIQEGQFVFNDGKLNQINQAKRLEKIGQFENLVKFEED